MNDAPIKPTSGAGDEDIVDPDVSEPTPDSSPPFPREESQDGSGPIPPQPAFDFESEPGKERHLHPRIKTAWLLSNIVGVLMTVAIAFTSELLWLHKKPDWSLPLGTISGAVSSSLIFAILHPGYFYRSWRYSLRRHDVLMRFGVLWKTEQSVPLQRIQHVDIQSGPIERLFGLCRITLYTAGSGDADAKIPGLTWDEAQAIRESLLGES